MKKPKEYYRVFIRYSMVAEEPENCFSEGWKYLDKTLAVSEEQAINNVRHRVMGDEISQYMPIATGGHWETWYEWKAEKIEYNFPAFGG